MRAIFLARLSASFDRVADRRVHLFDAHQYQQDGARKAFCGFTVHHTLLELVPDIGGLACELCIRDAPDNVLSPCYELTFPEDDPTSTTTYAVGLRGEREWHRIPDRPLLSYYEQRTVVICECGVIGYLLHGRPPPGWRECRECTPELPKGTL